MLIAAIVGGGLAVVLVIGAVFFLVLKSDKKSATEKLATAATSLSASKALSLKGTFGSPSDAIEGDLKVTGAGRATGPVTWSGDRVTLLSADGNLYVKADKAYWDKQITSNADLSHFISSGERWGSVEPNKLTFDFKANLTPAALAAKMRQITKLGVKSETKTTAQGRKATKITTLSASYYLSDEKEPRLLRVESTFPAYSTDITPQTGTEASSTVSEFRNRIGELKDALETTRTARVQKIEGCSNRNVSGCTVRVRVYASGPSGSSTPISVYVWLTATTPQSGRKLGDCTASVTTTGTNSEWAECRVSGGAWSSFFGQNVDRKWVIRAEALSMGVSPSSIQTMQSGLDRE